MPDEIQKVNGWSETVKSLGDAELTAGDRLSVLPLRSSALPVQKGLSESLAGRYLLFRCPHWGYREVRCAFGADLDRWLHFGDHPGAYALAEDEPAWGAYLGDPLIETTLARDVLQMQTVAKPALLRLPPHVVLELLVADCPGQHRAAGVPQRPGRQSSLANANC